MANKAKDKKVKKQIVNKNLVIFTIVLGIFLGLLFFLPVFNVTEINVTNNKKTSRTDITEASGIKVGNNIFRIVGPVTKGKIEALPYVKNAEVTKKYPSTINISVEEREIKYILSLDNSYLYIDDQGYTLEKSNVKVDGKLLIKDMELDEEESTPGNRLSEHNLLKLNDISNILEEAKLYYTDEEKTTTINSIINEITIDNYEYILYSEKELKTIFIGNGENLTLKMSNLQSILIKEKGNEGSIYLNMDLLKKYPYFSPKI